MTVSSVGAVFNPISWAEIDAYSCVMGERPEPWKIRALIAMDRVRLELERKPAEPPALTMKDAVAMLGGKKR